MKNHSQGMLYHNLNKDRGMKIEGDCDSIQAETGREGDSEKRDSGDKIQGMNGERS